MTGRRQPPGRRVYPQMLIAELLIVVLAGAAAWALARRLHASPEITGAAVGVFADRASGLLLRHLNRRILPPMPYKLRLHRNPEHAAYWHGRPAARAGKGARTTGSRRPAASRPGTTRGH